MNTKPNPFMQLVNNLEETQLSGQTPNFLDPNLSNVLDAYAVLQQCTLTHHLQSLLAPDPQQAADPSLGKPPSQTFLTSAYLRTLTLMERSKSRFDRIAGRLTRKPTHAESFQLNAASQFLLTELSDGEKPAREVIKTARSIGISERTLDRAKAELGIVSIQRTISSESSQIRCWVWTLPQPPHKTRDSKPETPGRQGAMAP